MAKPWRVTEQVENEIRQAFEAAIKHADVADGKFSFTAAVGASDKRRAELRFSPLAWTKMLSLVDQFDCEVGWDGTVQDLGNNRYLVDDIIVFPQTVTGATVDTDQAEYEKWLAKLPQDTFERRRFNGHSHVRMGVTPSGTDESNRRENVKQLKETTPNPFWIFMIINKFNAYECRIYDYRDNVIFEKADIDVTIDSPNGNLTDFIKNAKEIVKQKTYTTTYSGNSSATTTYGGNSSAAKTTAQSLPAPKTEPEKEKKAEEKKDKVVEIPKEKKADKPSWRPQPSIWGDLDDDDGYVYGYGGWRGYGSYC